MESKEVIIRKIRKDLIKEGIDYDVVDIEALVDSKLNYSENRDNIFKIIRQKKTDKRVSVDINHELKDASDYNKSRSINAQNTDSGIKAKRVISETMIRKNPAILSKWYNHPELYDIEGIDVHAHSVVKKKVKK